jgi:hypothetical protein
VNAGDAEYHFYADNNTCYDVNGNLITTEGIAGLKAYLTEKNTVTREVPADYSIV